MPLYKAFNLMFYVLTLLLSCVCQLSSKTMLMNDVNVCGFCLGYQTTIFGVANQRPCTGRRQVIGRATGHVTSRWFAVRRSVSATCRVSATACMNVARTTARRRARSAISYDCESNVRRSHVCCRANERFRDFSFHFRYVSLSGTLSANARV